MDRQEENIRQLKEDILTVIKEVNPMGVKYLITGLLYSKVSMEVNNE